MDIKNFFLEFVPSDIHHAYEQHIKAKEYGDIDLSREDFENIPKYIDEYSEMLYAKKYDSGNTKIALSVKKPNGRVLVISVVSKSHGSIAFKNMIGLSEEKYVFEYENVYKKETARMPEGAKAPIPLCVTKLLLLIVYPKTAKKTILLMKIIQKSF